MKDTTGTDQEKAFLFAFLSFFLAIPPLLVGETSDENLRSAQANIRLLNNLARYFGVSESIVPNNPNEIFESNEKILVLREAASEIISGNYSYYVLSAFKLGFLAATISFSKYYDYAIPIDAELQDFTTKCKELSIKKEAMDEFLETSEPSVIIKEFHKAPQDKGSVNTNIILGESAMSDTYHIDQAGAVGRFARSDNNTFIKSGEQRFLTEAAAKMQQLLKQLEDSNSSATEIEKIDYINDETTPSFKRRVVSMLQESGETAIDEFILENKYLKVVKAAVKGWLKSDR